MPRSTRPDPVGGWHHVMSRGVNRVPIFSTDSDRVGFGRLLGETVERFGVEIHAYCLMGNHFHLLLRCPDGGLSAAMHHLLSTYARILNDTTGRVGHLFGDRFCSRLISNERYLANVVRYIHLNPADIAAVSDIGDYRWSSHRTYLGHRRRPVWLTTGTVSSWFADPWDFDRFVRCREADRCDELDAPIDALLSAIDMMLVERTSASHRHLPAQRRAVALTLTQWMSAADRHDLLQLLGIESGGARRTAFSRARTVRSDEPVIDMVVAHVRAMFRRKASATAALRPA